MKPIDMTNHGSRLNAWQKHEERRFAARMKQRPDHAPSVELRCYRFALVVIILGILFGAIKITKADALLPVYDAAVGMKGLSLCPKGKERQLWLIVNPNSGPGDKRDAGMAAVLSLANAKGCKVLFYIDAKAIPGDGLTPKSAKEHVKTPTELVDERTAYSRFYGSLKWDGWFIDDFAASMKDVALCVSNWPGTKVLNPGCAMVPVGGFSGAIVVISEQAKAWPRALTPWEQSHRSQCAVMGLSITADSLPAFLTSTRGMAFRYASPLDDQWRNGQSAYTTLTPHFGRLFE